MAPRLGIFSWFGHRLPLRERLALIAEAGFETVSLWLGPEEELVAAGQPEQMLSSTREFGLGIDHAHAPFRDCNRLWSDERDALQRWSAGHHGHLEFCHRHGIARLVIHAVENPCPEAFPESGLQEAARLVTRAERLGVVLAIENTCSEDCIGRLLGSIQSPFLGLCYDSSHDFLPGQTRGRLLETWGARLVATHLSDNLGTQDDHFLPGLGQVDWRHLASIFPRDSYRGDLLFELLPRPQGEGPASQFLAAAHGAALRVRSLLGCGASSGG